jgi:hypothetical protein
MNTALSIACSGLAAVSAVLWLRQRRARREAYIRDFVLPHGLFDKLRAQHPHLSLKDCQLVAQGLRQFFLAHLKSGRQYVSMPSQVADDLWHEFILYTRNYDQFCRKAFGRFLHHTPAAVLGKGQQGNAGIRRTWFHACHEENINPRQPSRLPLLFALDGKLAIPNGFTYIPDCSGFQRKGDNGDGAVPYCAADLSSSGSGSGCGGGSDFSSCGGDGGSDGGSDGSGDSGGSSCGGGGCGGGD